MASSDSLRAAGAKADVRPTFHSGLARGGLGHFGVNFFIAFFGVFCILYIHINMEKSIKNKINIVKVLKITHFWGTNAHFTL